MFPIRTLHLRVKQTRGITSYRIHSSIKFVSFFVGDVAQNELSKIDIQT